MRKILFLILIFSALLYSCNKTADQTRPINPDLLKYFSYKPGTYWVYKDSIAGEVDSFYVTDNTKSTYTGPPNIDVVYVGIHQMNENGLGDDSTKWVMNLSENSLSYSVRAQPVMGDCDYSPLFSFPFQITTLGSESTNFKEGAITNVFPTLSVASANFNNVAQIHYYGYNLDDWYYINTDVGIVKMRWSDTSNINNKVWELQRWNIVR